MRAYTIAVSVLVHLTAGSAIVIAPLFATIELPEPRRAVEFIEVIAKVLPVVALERRTVPSPGPAVSPTAAPLVAPDTIGPDTGIEPAERTGERIDAGIPGDFPGTDAGMGVVIGDPVPPPPPPAPAPVRVGGAIKPPQKVRDVPPVYPTLALAARKEGIVILEAVIGEDGRVRNLRVLRSIPLLDDAAVNAVRQWQFTPTLLNGEPVPVVMTVTVAFQLK